MEPWLFAALTGAGATLVLDLWSLARAHLFGIAPPDYRMVGRWLAWLPRGRLRHHPIASSAPMPGELGIGWTAHYLIGIAFAAMLIPVAGSGWFQRPTLAPALLVGIGSVLAPLFVMQPAMGFGIAASRTPRPATARLRSLATHAVFGLGLYAAGWATLGRHALSHRVSWPSFS